MELRHEEQTERRGWFSRLNLSWPMLLLAGWLLYELTMQPTLGAVAVCLKFGWEDFRSAIWLRRNDPRRLRGRACFWLYLASGLAKTAGVAGLMSIAFVAISPKGPAAQGPRWAAIMEMAAWTGLATLTGLACAIVALGYAVVVARWGGFKLWLSNDIHSACRRNEWPPYEPSSVGNNRLKYLLLAALLIVLFPPLFFALAVAAIKQLGGQLVPVILFLLTMGVPMLVLLCKDRVSRWLVASHPGECWDTDFDLPPQADNVAEMIGNPIE
jgi:hypothetical protein